MRRADVVLVPQRAQRAAALCVGTRGVQAERVKKGDAELTIQTRGTGYSCSVTSLCTDYRWVATQALERKFVERRVCEKHEQKAEEKRKGWY